MASRRRFTQNTILVDSLKELNGFNPVAIAGLPLAAIYYIAGLSLTKDVRGADFLRALYWIGIVCLIVSGILYGIAVKKGDYKRQTSAGAVIGGYVCGHAFFSMFNTELEDIRTFNIVFFSLSIAVIVGEYVYPSIKGKSNSVIIANLNKCYLELTSTNISGIAFGNISTAGDGTYFEIEYKDVRQARWTQTLASNKQFYNLYIDTKYGTYSLSITDSKTASELINKAVGDVASGKEVSFPENKPLFTNVETKAANSYRAGAGEWVCPSCGKVHQNYVGSCGCGQVKPR